MLVSAHPREHPFAHNVIPILRSLLGEQAKPNTGDANVALACRALIGDVESVQLLLGVGAQPNQLVRHRMADTGRIEKHFLLTTLVRELEYVKKHSAQQVTRVIRDQQDPVHYSSVTTPAHAPLESFKAVLIALLNAHANPCIKRFETKHEVFEERSALKTAKDPELKALLKNMLLNKRINYELFIIKIFMIKACHKNSAWLNMVAIRLLCFFLFLLLRVFSYMFSLRLCE